MLKLNDFQTFKLTELLTEFNHKLNYLLIEKLFLLWLIPL